MQHDNLVTIVIPFRNRIGMVRRAVESVLQQSHTLWELILVDDCSSEYTIPSLVDDPRIKILHNEHNLGPSSSRQKGLSKALGTYVCFLDSDDIYHPLFLEKLLEAHSTDANITFSYCTSAWIDIDGQICESYKTSNISFKTIMPHLLLNNRPWHTSSLMWKREYIANWNKNFRTWEDYLIEFQSSKINNKIIHVQEVLCFIYKDEEQGLSMAAETSTAIAHRSKTLQIMLQQCETDDIVIKENIISRLKKEVIKLSNKDQNSQTLRRIFLLIRPYSLFSRFLGRDLHWIMFKRIIIINLLKKVYLKVKWI